MRFKFESIIVCIILLGGGGGGGALTDFDPLKGTTY